MQRIKASLGWNTGRLYQAVGQEISAHRTDDGRILFNDHSRCIFGRITDDIEFTPRAIQAAYDRNAYRWDGEASWIDAEVFPSIRM